MDKITLVFTKAEADFILNSLALRPFSEVYQLIAKIQSQAAPQFAPKPKKVVVAKKDAENEAV
jgi:hypothetical protein